MPAAKMAKITKKQPARKSNDDSGMAMIGLAQAIEGVGEHIRPLYHIEPLADYIGDAARALDSLAKATALTAIAQYANSEDRTKAVDILKGWFDEFR